jgi:hypothetical protein
VRRLAVKFGHPANCFHDQQAQDLKVSTLEMDICEASPIGETAWLRRDQSAATVGRCGHCPQPCKSLASWSMAVYHWVRPHRSLRPKLAVPEGKRRYQQRTPAMALGLTQRIWSEADVLRTPVYPGDDDRGAEIISENYPCADRPERTVFG